MATTSPTQPRPLVDAISITCPPIPNGGGNGLWLQPNFTARGDWNSEAANPVVGCVFNAGGTIYNPASMSVNTPPPNTWSATFNIPAGTNGMLQATIKVNNVVTAQSPVTNLQVVASGGGTCN
jgi:hypothetical protein